jgi:hypothetical protein
MERLAIYGRSGLPPVVQSSYLRGCGFRYSPRFEGYKMNVLDGLQNIRERLVENDAEAASLATVDLFIKRASLPAAKNATVNSQLQLVRMLMRTPESNTNVRVYNDFVRLEEEMEIGAADAQARRAAEDAKPVPKTKKFYKEQKEREKKASAGD